MTYRGFSVEELEKEYSPSSMIGGDIAPYLEAYAAISENARDTHAVKENLKYGPSKTRVLDYFPAETANAPLHVFIHGGYWQALSQKDSATMAGGVIDQGHALATLNYTLAPECRLGQMVEECRDALLWLAKEAASLGHDVSRLVLSGHSAGAHLAAMTVSLYDEMLKNAGIHVKSLILISGIYDLEPIAQVSVNDVLQLTPQDVMHLSPIAHLPDLTGQVRVTVGEHDTSEFIRQSRDYAEHLRRGGLNVSFDLQKGLHHFNIILRNETFQTERCDPDGVD